MALQWAVVILDNVSAFPSERQQDLAKIGGVDMTGSEFRPTTSAKPTSSRLRLSFPIATPDLFITEMMEVWAGWRDDVTDVWSDVDPDGFDCPVFGGYIQRIDAETVYGGEKTFDCTLVDYTILLTKTDVLGWPNFIDKVPLSRTGKGWVGGSSVQDWLIGMAGSSQWPGVVRQFLGNGVRYDGVDPIFATITINDDTLPGYLDVIPSVGAIQGYFGGGGTTVDSIVKVIADCAVFTYFKNYYSGPDLVVGYWMEAAIGEDDTRVVPKFRFANIADLLSSPDFVVATDADESIGEVQMLHPHRHERDASEIRTGIVVFGEGGDLSQTPPYPLVYSQHTDSSHQQVYPTYYQTATPWWGGGPLFDKRVHTVQTAEALATFIEQRVWGAKGSIEFYIKHPVTAGQRIQVRDTNENIDRVYIVTEAEGPNQDGQYRVRVGFTQPTVSDVISGGLSDVILTQEDLYYQASQGTKARSFWPGQATPYPIEAQPQHIQQNWITPASRAVPGLTIQGTIFTPVIDPAGAIEVPMIGENDADLLRALPLAQTSLSPPVLYPPPNFWVSHADARPHPNVFHIAGYTEDGVYPITIAAYRVHLTKVTLKGPGKVSLWRNGGPSTGGVLFFGPKRALDDGTYEFHLEMVLRPTDNAAIPSVPDDLHVEVIETSTTIPTFVVVWEAWDAFPG